MPAGNQPITRTKNLVYLGANTSFETFWGQASNQTTYAKSIVFESTTGIIYRSGIAYGSSTAGVTAIENLLKGKDDASLFSNTETNNIKVKTSVSGGFKVYTLSVKTDNSTIVTDSNGKLKANYSIGINSTNNSIELRAGGTAVGAAIPISTIVGGALVQKEGSGYDASTGNLTLKLANGSSVVIGVQDLLDINDIVSGDLYLNVSAPEGANEDGTVGQKQISLNVDDSRFSGGASAFGTKDTTTKKHLASAAAAKDYIDNVTGAISVSAEVASGSANYLTASATNNKVTVGARVQSLNIGGTTNSGLATSSDVASSVNTFVTNKIGALDAEKSDANSLITVKQVDGKLDSVSLTKANYANGSFGTAGVVTSDTLVAYLDDEWAEFD